MSKLIHDGKEHLMGCLSESNFAVWIMAFSDLKLTEVTPGRDSV